MKVQIESARNGDVSWEYGEVLKQAGFEVGGEDERYLINFDFSRLPDLVNAVQENVIVNYSENKDVIQLTIYDCWIE